MSNVELAQPFILFASNRFVDAAKKPFDLGFVVRKSLVKIYYSRLVGPKGSDGWVKARKVFKAIMERVAVEPIMDEHGVKGA